MRDSSVLEIWTSFCPDNTNVDETLSMLSNLPEECFVHTLRFDGNPKLPAKSNRLQDLETNFSPPT